MRKPKRHLGSSTLIPKVEGEGWRKRHARRLAINLEYYDWLKDQLSSRGYNLKSDNDRWVIWNSKVFFEFWPAQARLVRNRKYRQAIHCFDVLQLLEVIP